MSLAVFGSFTDECKRALDEARKESQRLGSGCLDAEHVLLGLLRVQDSTAARMLEALGIACESLRARVLERPTFGETPPVPGQMPFTHRCKRVLEVGMEEAEDLGDPHVGTEHMLIAYARIVAQDGPPSARGVIVAEVHRLRWALGAVRRGEQAPGRPATSASHGAAGAEVTGSASDKLIYAARICDNVMEELILRQHFEGASRTRDLAHWLRLLAEDISVPPK